jgi:E3 ubiquitin-protein ligase HERC4
MFYLCRSFEELLAYNKPDLDEVFNLTFEITKEIYGEIQTIPLKPDGSNIIVNQNNKLVNITIN